MDQNDWRLGGQDRYLKGVTLFRRAYSRYRESWDHDHCAFCWTKFMVEDGPGVLHEGYCTEDGYHCKRLKLAGALVLKEAIVSCPRGHGASSTASCADRAVARSLSASR